MQPLRRMVIALVLFCAVLLSSSLVIANVSAAPVFPPANITLTETAGNVEFKEPESTSWNAVSGSVIIVSGVEVRTDETGSATINFADQGETRLDHNTTVTVTDASWNPETPDVFTGSVFLETGRLWSRVFTFLSPEASFEVQTPNAVATVRGTTFAVWTSGSEDGVYVDEHAVRVLVKGQTGDVEEGEFMTITPKSDRLFEKMRSLPYGWETWVEENRVKDRAFDQEVFRKLRTVFRDGAPSDLERLKLLATVSPKKREALRTFFELRRRFLNRIEVPDVSAEEPSMLIDTTATYEIRINGLPGDTFAPSGDTLTDQSSETPALTGGEIQY